MSKEAMEALERLWDSIPEHHIHYKAGDWYATIQTALTQQGWRPISEPWPGTNTRAYNGQAVDVLLNGTARIPDVYFDFETKEFLTCGTDVPVILQGDPFNKITHWMPIVEPPSKERGE